MTVRELSDDQLVELKQRMVDDEIYEVEGRSASYGELAAAENIPDERVFEHYDGVDFSNDDFLCTAGHDYTYVMHVTETVESTYVITSEVKLSHEDLERRTEEARADGRLRFKAVSDVDIHVEAAYPGKEPETGYVREVEIE